MKLKETFERVKKASKRLALLSDTQRNDILNAVADAIIAQQDRILRQTVRIWPRWTNRIRFMTVCN